MFKLKNYQQQAIEALSSFLKDSSSIGIEKAFEKALQSYHFTETPYRSYGFDEMPYVCIRIPTGGGKTLLASYAIVETAKNFLFEDYPITIWLVPTNTIREQTVDALKTAGHPYRVRLEQAFQDNVTVYDIDEVDRIRASDLGNKAIIIVSTLANLRVKDTASRKIYAYHENFEPHFAKLSKESPCWNKLERVTVEDLQENGLTQQDIGKIKYSFVNLLAMYNPIVIIDEAHNARTPLTFEVLKRIYPAAIIEFTATPDKSLTSGSNVLYHVSAAELKAEEMIKLPVILTEHQNWRGAVRDSVLCRNGLATEAQKDENYIRPIVLLQAESKDGEVTVDVLKKELMEEHNISEDKIAIATGKERGIQGIDLFDPSCPIEYIITIEALKEGWDCSFAYVFCSVKQVKSNKDVEQLLGRVLRMPYAKRRLIEDLNRAYAHLSSDSFATAAKQLADKMIDMGFEALEVATFVKQTNQFDLFNPNKAEDDVPSNADKFFVIEIDKMPETSLLSEEDAKKITIKQIDDRTMMRIEGVVSDEIKAVIKKISTTKKNDNIDLEVQIHNYRVQSVLTPSERNVPFVSLPRLCFTKDDQLELLEPKLNISGWSLLDYPQRLENFQINEKNDIFTVDMAGKKVVYKHTNVSQLSLNLNDVDSSKSIPAFVSELDRDLRQQDISQGELLKFISGIINHLLQLPNMTLTTLIRNKFMLIRAIDDLIASYREKAYAKDYQYVLFGDEYPLEASYKFNYKFLPKIYPVRSPYYQGSYIFSKHYYNLIEDLKSTGEEFDCAVVIDGLPQVKHWVRNLERREAASFSLPLAHGNFYPDFIAELNDGRILVVEYKGEVYASNDDSAEKRAVGHKWAELSNGKCLFIMTVKKDEKGRDVRKQILDLL
jgi:type III restriction enzyme